ncbi:MAG: galactokinase [Flavobacteriaceae bacterium]|nr:galactokinase [Flavobacteriaceae bacterium]
MKTITSIAPARTCLFGDHQDYLGLPVIACAIDRHIKLIARKNSQNVFRINMIDIQEMRIIDINDTFPNLKPRDYFASSLRVLRRHGCIPHSGYDIDITGNIPINAGISSSSALLLGWINFLISAFGVEGDVTPDRIAEFGYLSEIKEHGEPGGMMDHYSIGVGNIVYIDTTEPFSCSVIGTEMDGLIIGVSGVPKETVGVLKDVKTNALKAIELVKKRFPDFNLKKETPKDLDKYMDTISDGLKPYFEAAIKNHYYTKEAVKEFEKSPLDLKEIGELMNGHHAVLRDLLNITVPRIDDMIDAALSNGAYGAKIVGSGGGGCIVAITPPDKEDAVVKAILNAGAVEAYKVAVDPGARISN